MESFTSLSDIIKKDGTHCYLVLEYPTTYLEGEYRNEKLYRLCDYRSGAKYSRTHLIPWRYMPILGHGVPVMLQAPPPAYLQEHWKQWIAGYTSPTVIDYPTGFSDDVPVSFSIPFEEIPKAKHLVDPDTWYELYDKATVPRCGAVVPQHFDTFQAPCMIKVSHGCASKGVWMAETQEQGESILRDLRSKWDGGIIYQAIVRGLKENVCAQFYMHRDGSHTWVGVSHQIFSEVTHFFQGGKMSTKEQVHLREKYEQFLLPVFRFLHNKKYVGFCGVDVVQGDDDGLYVVDINPRPCGSTPMLFLSPIMASLGFTEGFIRSCEFRCSASRLVQIAGQLNGQKRGMCVILSAGGVEDSKCRSFCCFFAATDSGSSKLYSELVSMVDQSNSVLGYMPKKSDDLHVHVDAITGPRGDIPSIL